MHLPHLFTSGSRGATACLGHHKLSSSWSQFPAHKPGCSAENSVCSWHQALEMPDKRAVPEILSPLSLRFILLPLSPYYNVSSIVLFSLSPFQLRLKETKLDRKITAFPDQLMQLGWAEQALRCTAAPPGARSGISPSCLSPQHSTALVFIPLTPASLPPPSSLLILGALSFLLTSSLLSLLAVTRQENTDLGVPYMCFSFFSGPSLAVDFSFL